MALMKGVGNQLAAMGLARELDPAAGMGYAQPPAPRKRGRMELQRLVASIIEDPQGEELVTELEEPALGMQDWCASLSASCAPH